MVYVVQNITWNPHKTHATSAISFLHMFASSIARCRYITKNTNNNSPHANVSFFFTADLKQAHERPSQVQRSHNQLCYQQSWNLSTNKQKQNYGIIPPHKIKLVCPTKILFVYTDYGLDVHSTSISHWTFFIALSGLEHLLKLEPDLKPLPRTAHQINFSAFNATENLKCKLKVVFYRAHLLINFRKRNKEKEREKESCKIYIRSLHE